MLGMRVVCTSDLHGALPHDFPEGDVLVIAGDVCPIWNHDRAFQANWLKGDFRDWLAWQPFEHKIFIAGNHDFVLQSTPTHVLKSWFDPIAVYLQDEEITIDGVKFYGTPWSPNFGRWAFMADEDDLEIIYSIIPADTDMLISHGPPKGACDLTVNWGNEHVGSTALRERLAEISVPHVICGHIHEAYGTATLGKTEVHNVAYLDLEYKPTNEPMVIEL